MTGYDLEIDLMFDKQLQDLPLNMMMRHELFFFYKETMMFLIQHRVCHHLFVNFKLTHSKLLLEILTECNKPQESIEKPLLNKVQKRINSLNANFEIDTDSKSLSLVLVVPVK